MHTIKQIIDNQKDYKNEIATFLKSDMSNALKTLKEIEAEDSELKKTIDQFKKRVKKMKKPSLHTLFFMSKNRSLDYYAWWDTESEEAIIYKYDKIQ